MTCSVPLVSIAAERNCQPMLDVLRRVLPQGGSSSGRALEIASGTGQHVAWFARHLPHWRWQPTECNAACLASIEAWCHVTDGDRPPSNIEPPRQLDVCRQPWPLDGLFDLIVCANMLHIAPWLCCSALMRGAATWLAPQGVLVTYGPYFMDDVPAAPSNLAFDADLRARNSQWGVRKLEDVAAQAAQFGLRLRERFEMPANNLMLIFAHEEQDAVPQFL